MVTVEGILAWSLMFSLRLKVLTVTMMDFTVAMVTGLVMSIGIATALPFWSNAVNTLGFLYAAYRTLLAVPWLVPATVRAAPPAPTPALLRTLLSPEVKLVAWASGAASTFGETWLRCRVHGQVLAAVTGLPP